MESLKNDDWSGEVSDVRPISNVQLSIIEGLLITSAVSERIKEELDNSILYMTQERAYKTIKYLEQHNVPYDPREQYKQYNKYKEL